MMELFRHTGVRLALCAVILAAAAAVRLFWPEGTQRAAQALAPVLYESLDLREAAETLGGAIGGSVAPEEVLAVFFPTD